MEALLLLIMCAGCITCFVIGAKVGQTASKGEYINLPSPNPIKAIREREERKEAKAEADRLETIIDNIERYDGTSRGQKDVPGKR